MLPPPKEERMKEAGYTPAEWEYQDQGAREYRKKGIMLYRTKETYAGEFLDVEMYPVIDMDHAGHGRGNRTKEAQKKLNAKNAQKKLARLMNANFGKGDLLVHLTCAKNEDEETAMRQARNFISRLRTRARKAGVALKYIYVIETTGENEHMRHHIHMVMNGGWIERDDVEKLWGNGLSRVDRYQEQDGGLKGFAMYITNRKSTQEKLLKRKWASSKNLIKPITKESSTRFSRRAAMKIAMNAETDAKKEFEKRYPGYRLIEMPEIRYSDMMPGAYIYASLRRMN